MLLVGHDGRQPHVVAATLQTPAIGRLDAADGRQRGAVGLPASPARLATGLGAAWATSYDDGTLLRLDPTHLAISQTIRVGHGPTGVAVAAGDVWVANTLDNTLSRVDGATSSIVQRIPVGILRPMRFHDLRHSYGSLLVAGGIDLASVKGAMGHASLATTERYLHARPATKLADKFTTALQAHGLDAPRART